MDVFSDSELFDESAPHVRPEADGTADLLTVSPDRAVPRLGEGVLRHAVYVIAVLAVLGVAALALRAGHPSPEHNPSHRAARKRQPRARPTKAGTRVRARVHHHAPGAQAPAPVGPSRVIVTAPSSGAERPTRDENVGSGRPISPSPVGKTEQFAYLGE